MARLLGFGGLVPLLTALYYVFRNPGASIVALFAMPFTGRLF